MDTLYHVEGCDDHGCQIQKPEGMGTNGGCRCVKNHITVQKVFHNYRILLEEFKRLDQVPPPTDAPPAVDPP